jgi:2-keto-4-pentenoate hydratase/2-oxohepta-3-ene-1,7-dioic acid hydratase in catechol pathway
LFGLRSVCPITPYLRAGDLVRLEIDGLGQAEQRFVAAP